MCYFFLNHRTKRGHLPTFSVQTPHYLGKVVSVVFDLSLGVAVQHKQNNCAKMFSTQWQSNIHCILQGLIKSILMFFAQKRALSRRSPQELEVDPRNEPYLLVHSTSNFQFRVWNVDIA